MRTLLVTLHSKFIHNSLALPCLAAYCSDRCGEILIREFTVHEPRQSILAQLLAEDPDVVAFSVYLWNRLETLALMDALAVAKPSLRIVLGGPEVSFDGQELFARHPGLTALVHGEGEGPLRALLHAWSRGEMPEDIPRLTRRAGTDLVSGPDGPVLDHLDDIPSPFQRGLVCLDRGFVYLETSRGCPYRCSFCMSALDDRVRSYSMERIHSDLDFLMEREVPKIKLVDRTFNYDAQRAREIFSVILARNRSSHFHFEIGAHLLDDATLDLLAEVPPGMFQFEIGVQSMHDATLEHVERSVPLRRLEENVARLRADGRIHLHLDLVAGLPGESYGQMLASINRVADLRPDHLQVEAVKVLPGSPLRRDAARGGLRFDPTPPYTVLETNDISFEELEQLRCISHLLDLTWNSGCFRHFMEHLQTASGSLAEELAKVALFWRDEGLFRYPMSRHDLFRHLDRFVRAAAPTGHADLLREALACDYALCERVNPKRPPGFFTIDLDEDERLWVDRQVRRAVDAVRGKGVKLQYFAAVFDHLFKQRGRTVALFLYRTATGAGRTTEMLLRPDDDIAAVNGERSRLASSRDRGSIL